MLRGEARKILFEKDHRVGKSGQRTTDWTNFDVDSPSLLCKRTPALSEVASGAGSHVDTVEDLYRQKYFEGLDLCIAMIKDHFDQPGYAVYHDLEEVLVMAANGNLHEKQLKALHHFYSDEFELSSLSVQLQNLSSFLSGQEGITLAQCMVEI